MTLVVRVAAAVLIVSLLAAAACAAVIATDEWERWLAERWGVEGGG